MATTFQQSVTYTHVIDYYLFAAQLSGEDIGLWLADFP